MFSEKDKQNQKDFELLITALLVMIGVCVVGVFAILLLT
jgi:hypothetical protein